MHWIYLIRKFHNLSWITEINELFHDILIYCDAPVYLSIWLYRTDVVRSTEKPLLAFSLVFFPSSAGLFHHCGLWMPRTLGNVWIYWYWNPHLYNDWKCLHLPTLLVCSSIIMSGEVHDVVVMGLSHYLGTVYFCTQTRIKVLLTKDTYLKSVCCT